MASTNPTTMQYNAHLPQRLGGYHGYAIPVPAWKARSLGVALFITPILGMAQGGIGPISREYPPPKKR